MSYERTCGPRMTAVILKILHPFKYPGLRAMSSEKIKNSFINCPPSLLAKMIKVVSLEAGPPLDQPDCWFSSEMMLITVSKCTRLFVVLVKSKVMSYVHQ